MHASEIRLRDARSVATWDPNAAHARAIEIGEHVSSRAIYNGDSATWRGLLGSEPDAPPTIGVLGSDFCDGATGIGLFLLALARKTGRADFHETGRQAFAPLRRELAALCVSDRSERMLGGTEGLTSCLYPLVVGAALGDCPALLNCAEQLAAQLTTDVIGADRQFDLAAGAAGAILGLLALHEAGRPIGLEKALACGRHLLACVPPPSSRAKPGQLAGLSRGASGFAVALARLGRASEQAAFLDAAASWVAYEDALFDKAHGNWPDQRLVADTQPDADFTVCSWCHGATGIGFARLGIARQAGLDMTRAIRRTITEPLADADSLCCGNFGRISFLLEAGIRLDRPELVAQARSRAAQRLTTCASAFPNVFGDHAQNLGFFQGVSGIGYELLRLLDPDVFPCALLWEVETGARIATRGADACA
jgi:lantibiotic modifying enzyme